MEQTVNSREKGNLGEGIACKYLEKQGYKVVLRNYRRKWGELDIIAIKDSIIHFIEVKSVTYGLMNASHTPEENVHDLKRSHIRRVVMTYFAEIGEIDKEFQFHVICVYLNLQSKTAKVRMIENIIL